MSTVVSGAREFVRANVAVLEEFHHRVADRYVREALINAIFDDTPLFSAELKMKLAQAAKYEPGKTVPLEFDLTCVLLRVDSIELLAAYARRLPDHVLFQKYVPSEELIGAITKCRRFSLGMAEKSQPTGAA